MATSHRGGWFSRNETLPKKDDDLKLPHHNGPSWQARTPRRRTLRFAIYAIVLLGLFLLLRGMIYSHNKDMVRRPHPHDRNNDPIDTGVPTQLTKPKSTPKSPVIDSKPIPTDHSVETHESPDDARHYRGTLKFKALSESLRQLSSTPLGFKFASVIFAASNLQSAATILPMACERAAAQQKERVLFALFGDADVKLETLLKVNGVGESCKIQTIDARADQSRQLSNPRLAFATARAIYYLATYLRPLAVVVDGSSAEDRPFLDGIKEQTSDAPRTTLIELPARAGTRMSWMSKLDAAALAEWNNVHFDILVHAPPTGTGNLKRLLRSLAAADLAGHSIPQLTVELPWTLDLSLERFLSDFKWPRSSLAGSSPSMLKLRHRIEQEKPSASQSVVRLLESFWPSDAFKSHALILSPHTEVSPQFFHYVKYVLLRRRHSTAGSEDDPSGLMFGISFTVPKTHIHNTASFSAPAAASGGSSSFIWQAPGSDAMLIFGDKWAELYGYVSHSLQAQKAGTTVPSLAQSKDVVETKPAWLEYMLQLCRLRGYFTVYPSKETADAIVGVYTDLPDVPEGREKSEAGARVEAKKGSSFDAGSQVDILNTLPDGGALPSLNLLPLLSWNGGTSTMKDIIREATKQAAEFRRQIGTCKDPEAVLKRDKLAADLFCAVKEGKSG
ncbi:hypothetical protein ISF_03285 [Cordyceps fumosorosea ARSEF 2679]|uniref:Glycosyltransferase 2 n=1 Tax=Cordyceps fumosorosea (strain ARSEF 2679) TaxID=1081104 RepID=A0A168ALG9_CORFA|nr:hypothetical protein ISF_03285 [Cordyceps fumosorosea ARSEF 2679]OAA68910.1 hypothetical protein ISF_03285 [Cordyceps fumosorosea ARSEF 2679]